MAFRIVCGLWVAPDFSDVTAGHKLPPRVRHSEIDYPALASWFKELFPYGPPISLRVPNDTIDQVTVYTRQNRTTYPTMRCEDFGQALLSRARKDKALVIDVRPIWQELHILKDRDFAPPPILLPFVVTATDFEDAMLWRASTRPSLGLKPFDVLEALNGEKFDHNGKLPAEALKRLEAIFGVPFLPDAVLDELCSDTRPAYAQTLG